MILTHHAAARMRSRGISQAEIERCIERGVRTSPGDGLVSFETPIHSIREEPFRLASLRMLTCAASGVVVTTYIRHIASRVGIAAVQDARRDRRAVRKELRQAMKMRAAREPELHPLLAA